MLWLPKNNISLVVLLEISYNNRERKDGQSQ